MKLHRVEGQPDWQKVPAAQWNSWQRAAARTHGVVTIGNFFSMVGLLSIPVGLWLVRDMHYIPAVIVLALGRLCDLLDGWLADRTGTKSPLGEKVDATFDKVSAALVLIGLYTIDFIPVSIVALVLGPHAIIAALALIAFYRGKQFHPSLLGKWSMAAIWLTILSFIAFEAFGYQAEDMARLLLFGVLAITVALNLAALVGYAAELARSLRKP